MIQSGVFVLQNDTTLVPMRPTQFAAEVDFQSLLTRFPTLLIGDQIDPESPRRFILVKQEQAIGHEADPSRWSIDHLFLDQDGIPTLVEVKRQSDTRVRREVVGQILEYAANCQASWTAETMRANFEATCSATSTSSESVLMDLLGGDRTTESFWSDVSTNLQIGKIRMLIVADQIPTELRRIVEFLNKQLAVAEILAIELRQFVGEGGLRTIVPVLFGQTQEAAKKRVTSAAGPRWTEDRFVETIKSKFSPEQAEAALFIFEWLKQSGTQLIYGTGRENGSVYPILKPKGVPINPAYLTTEGRIWLNFQPLIGKPIFDDVQKRIEMRDLFAKVAGSNLAALAPEGYAKLSFEIIAADPNGSKTVIEAWSWIVDQVKRAG